MALSAAFADVLAADRDLINARVAQARAQQSDLDVDAFRAFVSDCADPVFGAISTHDDQQLVTMRTLLQLGLDSVAAGFWRGQEMANAMRALWQQILPVCGRVLGGELRGSVAALSNALRQIQMQHPAGVAPWLQAMAAAAPLADDLPALKACGLIAAWRAGMAPYRGAALTAAEQLTPALGAALCAIDAAAWPHKVAAWRADRWTDLPTELRSQILGDFTGLGGFFASPPQPIATAEGLFVRSGDQLLTLHVDGYGAMLTPGAPTLSAPLAAPAPSVQGTMLQLKGVQVPLQLPTGALRVAGTADTLLLCSPWSYRVQIIARP